MRKFRRSLIGSSSASVRSEVDTKALAGYASALSVLNTTVTKMERELNGMTDIHDELWILLKRLEKSGVANQRVTRSIAAVETMREKLQKFNLNDIKQRIRDLEHSHGALTAKLGERDKALSEQQHYESKTKELEKLVSHDKERIERNKKKLSEASALHESLNASVTKEVETLLKDRFLVVDQILKQYVRDISEISVDIAKAFEQVVELQPPLPPLMPVIESPRLLEDDVF